MKELQVKTHKRSLAKGLLAGLIGGLAATAAKSLAGSYFRRARMENRNHHRCWWRRSSGIGWRERKSSQRWRQFIGDLEQRPCGLWCAGGILPGSYGKGRCGLWYGTDFTDPWACITGVGAWDGAEEQTFPRKEQ